MSLRLFNESEQGLGSFYQELSGQLCEHQGKEQGKR
jgi:hypothetical protein